MNPHINLKAVFILTVSILCGSLPLLVPEWMPLVSAQIYGTYQAPVATFTTSPPQGEAPITVTFDASNSYDPDGYIVDYTWLVNEQNIDGIMTSVTFQTPGEYLITLTVRDNEGLTAIAQQNVNVIDSQAPLQYNTTARLHPQIIAAGVTPSKLDWMDDEFDVIALIRPGIAPIRNVSLQNTDGLLRMAMTQAGVLPNGDELYRMTYIYESGSIRDTISTAWGSQPGQYNIIVTAESRDQSHTYPYLRIGNFPALSVATKAEAPTNYNTTARFEPQVIMAGYTPVILDISDDEFDIIAVVRAGALPIKYVVFKQNTGQFNHAMTFAGELDNGDKVYKMTFTYPRGSLGDPKGNEIISYKDLWGPDAEQFGIEVVDEAEQHNHKFPDIEFGNYPEYQP